MGLFDAVTGLAGGIAGLFGNSNQSSQQNNAMTTLGNSANVMPWSVGGAGGSGATFSNGNANLSAGSMDPNANQFSTLTGNLLGQANALGGQNPAGVTNAGNNYMNQLGLSSMFNGMGQQNAAGVMNNPLVNNAYGAANGLVNSAGSNFNSAYNTSLQSQLAALNPAIQQQSNALLNSQFERGQAGTSGGALQTQALQNSFNTADLNAQNNALGQANSIMGTTGNLANTFAGLGNNTFNTGANALNSFNMNGANLGQQGLAGQQSIAAFAPQLAQMFGSAANTGVQGFTGINNIGLNNGQFGMQLGAQQSSQMARAGGGMGNIATSNNNTNNANGISSFFNGISGSGGGGIGGMLSNIFGGLF